MTEELKACPFCSCTVIGEVTINPRLEQRHRRFKVYCKACQCRTSEHKTRKEARIYWNTRAQLPRQGGEAVEVVGVVCVSRFKNNPAMENVEFHQSADIPPGQHDLMTVAQHQRILAAATHPADQVAEGVVVSRELLELLCEMVDLHDRRGAVLTVHMEHLRALLASLNT